MPRPTSIAAAALFLAAALAPLALPTTTKALPESSQVALVGGESVVNGGGLFHASAAFSSFAFTTLAPASLTTATLAAFDTVVLNVGSGGMTCTTTTLTSAAKTALVDFVHAGGKLVIYDSECTPQNDYAWLPYPFTTNNPGAAGASGTLVIVEENSLSCSDAAQPCYVDVAAVGSQTDAVGDSNVVVTQDPNWCGDLKATNVNGIVGFNHMYATYGSGLLVYNGLDVDLLGDPLGSGGSAHLGRIWLLELQQAWSPANLPCSAPVVCGDLTGATLAGNGVVRVDLERPAVGFDYFHDAEHAQSPAAPVPRVLGPVTVRAATSDASVTSAIRFTVDGTLRATVTAPPYAFTWDPALEPTPSGAHTLAAIPDVVLPARCGVGAFRQVLVPDAGMDGRAVGLWVGNAVPATLDAETMDARLPSATANSTAHRRVLDERFADAEAAVLDDTTTGARVGGRLVVNSTSRVAGVRLLDGLVTADALVSEARASVDNATGDATVDAAGSETSRLVVAGTPVPPLVPPNTRIDAGGVIVVVNEQRLDVAPGRASATVNALHVYVPHATARAEVVLGQAIAIADAFGGATARPDRLMNDQDDANAGGDAPDTFATAMPLDATGQAADAAAIQGRLDAGDAYDFYSMTAAQGQKLVAVLAPATGVALGVDEVRPQPAPNLPSTGATGAGATVPDLTLRLLEPGTGVPRAVSALPLSAPERVELNVDVAGPWVLEVSGYGAGNYTLTVAVTPIPLLPDDEVTGPDAPATCMDARTPALGSVVDGVLKDDDWADAWRLDAKRGDVLTAILKPGEDADGADFDLHLFGPGCVPLATSALGKGIVPKGVPDAVVQLPVLVSGTYVVQVERYNGVGNYHLLLESRTNVPEPADGDARSGADAPATCAGATPLPVGSAYEGAFPDGDDVDVYAFPVQAGQRAVLTLVPAAGNDLTLTLRDAACNVLLTSASPLSVPEVLVYGPAVAGGTYHVEVATVIGGGNYVLGAGTL